MTDQDYAHLLKVITDWKQHSGTQLNREATAFREAVLSNASLAPWAGTDFSRIFPFRPLLGSASVAYALRSALIFLPILLTWLSLAGAAKGFAAAAATDTPLNFVLFWQTLPGIHSLSAVAYADALLILALVITTLYISLTLESPSRLASLHQRHDALLSAAERATSVHRVPSPDAIVDMSAVIHRNLSTAADHVRNAALALETVSTSGMDSVRRLEAVVTRDFLPIATRLDDVIKGLAAAAGAHETLVGSVQASQHHIASAFTALDSALAATSDAIRAALDAHRDAVRKTVVEAGREFTSHLQGQLSDSAETLQRANTEIRAQLDLLAKHTASVVVRGEKLTETSALGVAQAVERVHEVSNQVAESLQAIARSLETTVLHVRNDLDKIRAKSS